MKRKTSSPSTVQATSQLTDYVEHPSGARRSCVQPRFKLIPKEGLERLAQRFTLGANKYEADNWKKGLKDPQFLEDAYNHMMDHLLDFKEQGGCTQDDHLAAIAWGAFCLMEAERVRNKKVQS